MVPSAEVQHEHTGCPGKSSADGGGGGFITKATSATAKSGLMSCNPAVARGSRRPERWSTQPVSASPSGSCFPDANAAAREPASLA